MPKKINEYLKTYKQIYMYLLVIIKVVSIFVNLQLLRPALG